jgi:hypothetical protein
LGHVLARNGRSLQGWTPPAELTCVVGHVDDAFLRPASSRNGEFNCTGKLVNRGFDHYE